MSTVGHDHLFLLKFFQGAITKLIPFYDAQPIPSLSRPSNLCGSGANTRKFLREISHNKGVFCNADPQGTATRWAASAEDETPFPASVVGLSAASTKVHREVKKFIDDYNYIIIDCPPAADSPVPQSALLIADLALVPLIPSPLDMWAAVGIRQVIQNIGDLNDALHSRLILNQCQPKTTLTQESLEILPEFGILLAKTQIQHRQIYRQSAVFGQSVHNFGSKAQAAITEIESLTEEVLEILTMKEANP